VIVVYSEEGSVFNERPVGSKTPRPVLTNHQFFNRLAETFIAEVTRMTPEGALYPNRFAAATRGRVWSAQSLAGGYENYYAQWGQPGNG